MTYKRLVYTQGVALLVVIGLMYQFDWYPSYPALVVTLILSFGIAAILDKAFD